MFHLCFFIVVLHNVFSFLFFCASLGLVFSVVLLPFSSAFVLGYAFSAILIIYVFWWFRLRKYFCVLSLLFNSAILHIGTGESGQ